MPRMTNTVSAAVKRQPGLQALQQGAVEFSPRQVAVLRGRAAHGMAMLMPLAIEAALGQRSWTGTQVALFKTLLNKVLPDLEARSVVATIDHRHVTELSRDDLIRIVTDEGGRGVHSIDMSTIYARRPSSEAPS